MIDLGDFEVPELHRFIKIQQAHQNSQLSVSRENIALTLLSKTSLDHEDSIEEIEDPIQFQDYSANILDQMDQQEDQGMQEPTGGDEQDMAESVKRKKKLERRLKNQTKNIPKNFGKGIITFIQKNTKMIKKMVQAQGIDFVWFMKRIGQEKKVINTIADLRKLWTDQVIGYCMRILSNAFFRKHSLSYIFNSRISNYNCHIKYRRSLWRALENPLDFNHIKEY